MKFLKTQEHKDILSFLQVKKYSFNHFTTKNKCYLTSEVKSLIIIINNIVGFAYSEAKTKLFFDVYFLNKFYKTFQTENEKSKQAQKMFYYFI